MRFTVDRKREVEGATSSLLMFSLCTGSRDKEAFLRNSGSIFPTAVLMLLKVIYRLHAFNLSSDCFAWWQDADHEQVTSRRRSGWMRE